MHGTFWSIAVSFKQMKVKCDGLTLPVREICITSFFWTCSNEKELEICFHRQNACYPGRVNTWRSFSRQTPSIPATQVDEAPWPLCSS